MFLCWSPADDDDDEAKFRLCSNGAFKPAAFRHSSHVTQTDSKDVGNTEMLPVSQVTGMRPKATVANWVELVGFPLIQQRAWWLQKSYRIMTLSEYIFLPSSSRLILCATTVCCSSFPLMQTSAWCGFTCRVGLRGGKNTFTWSLLRRGNQITYWMKRKILRCSRRPPPIVIWPTSCCNTNVVQRGWGQCLLQGYITLLWNQF